MCVNFDTANVDLLFDDESSLVIDCNAVENQYGTTMRRRCELEWLIYNEPLSYAQMLLDGTMEEYLHNVAKDFKNSKVMAIKPTELIERVSE